MWLAQNLLLMNILNLTDAHAVKRWNVFFLFFLKFETLKSLLLNWEQLSIKVSLLKKNSQEVWLNTAKVHCIFSQWQINTQYCAVFYPLICRPKYLFPKIFSYLGLVLALRRIHAVFPNHGGATAVRAPARCIAKLGWHAHLGVTPGPCRQGEGGAARGRAAAPRTQQPHISRGERQSVTLQLFQSSSGDKTSGAEAVWRLGNEFPRCFQDLVCILIVQDVPLYTSSTRDLSYLL